MLAKMWGCQNSCMHIACGSETENHFRQLFGNIQSSEIYAPENNPNLCRQQGGERIIYDMVIQQHSVPEIT